MVTAKAPEPPFTVSTRNFDNLSGGGVEMVVGWNGGWIEKMVGWNDGWVEWWLGGMVVGWNGGWVGKLVSGDELRDGIRDKSGKD